MRFLLDENVPNYYKKDLEKYGYKDIKRINDFGKGLPDSEVFKISVQEERTLISIDTDFYAYKKEHHFGIISISGKLINPVNVIAKTIKQLEKDTNLSKYIFEDTFLRLTGEYCEIGYKKKGKYKAIKRKYKKYRNQQ